MPPKPAGDLKMFRARARKPHHYAARTTAPPLKCHETADFGCRWPQNRGIPNSFGNISAGAGLPEVDRYEQSGAISLALRRKGGGTLPRDLIDFRAVSFDVYLSVLSSS